MLAADEEFRTFLRGETDRRRVRVPSPDPVRQSSGARRSTIPRIPVDYSRVHIAIDQSYSNVAVEVMDPPPRELSQNVARPSSSSRPRGRPRRPSV